VNVGVVQKNITNDEQTTWIVQRKEKINCFLRRTKKMNDLKLFEQTHFLGFKKNLVTDYIDRKKLLFFSKKYKRF